ncbi:hypothetical protein E2C01_009462 [Portunus trituberculatus]|uniref:Uncharacterized protein n=1 Tax=Portunus trituberculatus TaxID=210409 RepID=A0A5B7D5U1_PORTR|nr:hypothetical protein [Portunus trituberculatus]
MSAGVRGIRAGVVLPAGGSEPLCLSLVAVYLRTPSLLPSGILIKQCARVQGFKRVTWQVHKGCEEL